MATSSTDFGKSLESYIKDMLDRAQKGATAAQEAGYPAESALTKSYYAGIPSLYMYGDQDQAEAMQRMSDLYGAYGRAGQYDKTSFGDIGQMYQAAGQYDPTQYQLSDYTAQNIKQRMNPYEELVAKRQQARMKEAYDEGRGEREAAAARANAYGGSGAAIQEELARRNYLDQLADWNAQSLFGAFTSGADLYGKEMADRLAQQQATEASRQFAKNTQFAGLQGLMGTREADAAQVAAAKEAELAALGGQSTSAQQQAAMAEQQKNMQLANLAAAQAGGQQQEERALAQSQYPLGLATLQAQPLATLTGGTSQVPVTTQKTSTMQNILGGLSAGAGVLQGLGGISGIKGLFGFADGGLVYNGGGLADLEPEYYDGYER